MTIPSLVHCRESQLSAGCPGILLSMLREIANDFVQPQTAVRMAVLLMVSVPTAMFGQRTALVSPELHKDSSVTFRLEQPGAHEVLVALAGLETPLKMTQAEG